ncbi:MAG: 4Fe-4S binding protein [Planctomycetes bacterium]|nr:4Fe-4S binding protein [Planctomycetota bacterium]
MKKYVLAAIFAAIISLAGRPARADERFPRPEFETGHELPSPSHPAPRADIYEYVDVAVLLAALALATYLALARRSRGGVFAVMVFSLLYFGFWRKGCVCAVGSLQNVTLALFDRTYAVPLTVLAFFVLPLVFTLLFGRTFCAAVCPLGAIQDVVLLRPVKVPGWLEGPLKMLPYLYLGAAVLFAATGSAFVICRFDPFVSLFRLSGSAGMLALGAAFLVISVFVGRPYCRFVCPYGVLLGWMSRLSKWHVTITPDECVQCRLCENSCPFGAIRKPTPEEAGEPREVGVRRLALLVVVLPVLVVAGAWTGGRLGGPLSRANATVRLAEQVLREQTGQTAETTLESEAFVGTGRPAAELYDDALAIKAQFASGGRLLGIFVALVFTANLIGLSIKRTRTDYEPDRQTCLSCGRCFSYCPREHLRLKKQKETLE